MNKNGIVFIVGLNLLVPVVKALLMSIDTCFTFLLIAPHPAPLPPPPPPP